MTDYDFKTLNDKEFEIFCADILGVATGRRLERFKPGKDAGVDGRFFASSKKEVIMQCKHRPDTTCTQLIKDLVRDEFPKISKLSPDRYLLAVSSPLSRLNKKAIFEALQPYVRDSSDIFGKEDLNDILSRHTEIERRHYKLWIKSTNVLQLLLNNAILGRSDFSLEEIILKAPLYVITAGHQAALQRLEELGAVIITGEPGIGKTTLAEHLCLHYVAKNYRYIKISDDLKEAEDVFRKDEKQIFYFDDFLGRNYLEALKGDESTHVVQFFRRVTANREKFKRFVLTSRSTILNQGKLLNDTIDHANLSRNEYELNIRSLSELEKAQILYNHIWHSGLPSDFIEQLYVDKRYRQIIEHKNFNPRLISYITDPTRLNFSANEYWENVTSSMNNPANVWENPFVSQQDDFGRAVVLLVVLNGRAIEESALCDAYNRFVALPDNQNLHGRREFQSNLRALTGSLLNRRLLTTTRAVINLFNPSIGDFVLNRYSNDIPVLRQALLSLYTVSSIRTIISMEANGKLTKNEKLGVFEALLKKISNEEFEEVDTAFVSILCKQIMEGGGARKEQGELQKAINYILNGQDEAPNDDSYTALKLAFEAEILPADEALNFVCFQIGDINQESEIVAAAELLSAIPESAPDHAKVKQALTDRVVEVVSDLLPEYVEVTDAFSDVAYGDYDEARRNLEELVQERLDDMGISYSYKDIKNIVAGYGIERDLDKYFEYDGEHPDGERSGETWASLSVDAIDDLFQRN